MKSILEFAKPYARSIVFSVLGTLLMVLSELMLPTLMARIVDSDIPSGNTSAILATGGLMLVIALIGAACSIWASYHSSLASMGYGRDLRSAVFGRAQFFSKAEMDKIGTASLITRTTNDIQQVQQALMIMLRMMVMAPLMCIGSLIMALSQDLRLSAVLLVAIPIIGIVIFMLVRKSMPLFKSMQKKLDRLNQVTREYLTGVRVVRAFERTESEEQRFNEANIDLTDSTLKMQRLMSALMPIMMMLLNLVTIAVMWFGAHNVEAGTLQVGALIAFVQYVTQILMSVMMASMLFVMLPRAQVSGARIGEVLEMHNSVTDADVPNNAAPRAGRLIFNDVSFTYPGDESSDTIPEPALEHISFTSGPGETTAIIGSTGSGKSTLVNLITRMYDANEGSITLDGVDVREMSQLELRDRIGFVPQKAFLFEGSIADNLRVGKPNATEADMDKALEIAQCTFIPSLNGGKEAYISQGGTNVSGGQRQRLAMARALIKPAELFVFDDSFSALDFKTDAALRMALHRELSDSNVIIVAQRVGTVMSADRIIVLDDGHMAGIGTHKELMETCEVYREIVDSQLTKEESA